MERDSTPKRYVWLVRLLVMMFGLLLIAIGSLLTLLGISLPVHDILNPILAGVGISLLAGVLTSIFQTAFAGETPLDVRRILQIKDRIVDRGLDAVHLNHGDIDPEARFPSLELAYTIDMMFNSGRFTMATAGTGLRAALEQRGCKVRFLLSNPENPVFANVEISEGLSPTATSIPHEIQDTLRGMEAIAKLLTNKQASLEVRLVPCIMTASMVIIDGRFLRLTPYLPYTHSADVPVFDIVAEKDARLFHAYKQAFDEVWEKSEKSRKVIYPRVAKATP